MNILTNLAVAAALVAAPAAAVTIDTTPLWDGTTSVGTFGGGNGTGVYGTTFVAPGSSITGASFFINDGGSAIDVIAQVFAWSGALRGGNGPQGATGPALFTSAQFSTAGAAEFREISFSTGATPLVIGQNYVVLLAATGTTGAATWGRIVGDPGVPGDGGFNFFNNDGDLAAINTTTWDSFGDFGSLAWTGTFEGGSAVVPEPQSWALMILGFGAVGATLRRRRASLALA